MAGGAGNKNKRPRFRPLKDIKRWRKNKAKAAAPFASRLTSSASAPQDNLPPPAGVPQPPTDNEPPPKDDDKPPPEDDDEPPPEHDDEPSPEDDNNKPSPEDEDNQPSPEDEVTTPDSQTTT
ncbi:hypothetical protein PCASD_24699 [Puccinia coronata f. sp. avenae]|uniref:Uncharacterized protein n=1 Tax=Puccinia coronata f. sp. avenae TaxID=200324 RepID=A0A2N5TIL5_9BASI|nr:hypothetical protein PCASD_24699 [Puccinia coronata f. sp. avenae]